MVQIIHKGQHLLRHKSQEVGYTNVSQPGIVTVKGAIDDIYTSLSSVLSWQAPVATPADLPLTGNTINDARVVQDDGDGGAAIYVCIATTGTLSDQWQKIADVDWGGSTVYTDTTFYVDGSTGSNSNTGEDWANALANLDFLYSEDANAIPRELQANITIYV
ncbi:MAG: hypothetical protein U9O94_06765, partial [Nanoarchaeota archaeon]|nr:hypothetical protein [Nanoarchaeota archaeon]